MKQQFSWVPFYKELGKKLLSYMDNMQPLVDFIYSLQIGNGKSATSYIKTEGGDKVTALDPFSVFGIFNRTGTWDNRKKICHDFKNFLSIDRDIPNDFEGIPIVHAMHSFFFRWDDKFDDSVKCLWKLFENAISDRPIDEEYDEARGYNLSANMLTMGLFWVNPDRFLSLDGTNRKFLSKYGGEQYNINTFEQYEKVCNDVREILKNDKEIGCSSFVELSNKAWITMHEMESKKNTAIVNVSKYNEYVELLKANKNLILTGAPGTGKTYMAKEIAKELCANEDNIKKVQFHPSYDYTDFVEGIRPNPNRGFERRDGVFKEFCKKALKQQRQDKERQTKVTPFVFIIDEINRGELSKIFGELFASIENTYRGKEGMVQTQYQNLVPADDEFSEGFYIPENVFVIGTMNDIDRSVESMDFAMRRRFAWKEVSIEESQQMLDKLQNKDLAIKRMNDLNHKIGERFGNYYKIGAAYFLKYDNDHPEKLWEYHLKGLISEYVRGERDADDFMGKCRNAYYGEPTTDSDDRQ